MTRSSGQRSLHLLVPGLIDLPELWLREQDENLASKELGRLLDRAVVWTVSETDFETALAASFSVSPAHGVDFPYGAVTRHAVCEDAAEGVWACADPLHLVAGISDVQADGGAALAVTRDEAVALAERFNAHFAGSGLILLPTRPDRWHLRLSDDPQIVTTPLGGVLGRPLRQHLPQGAGVLRWHALMTEAQMLFHDAPVNERREALGLPVVNGLWIWGIGRLPALHPEPAMVSADSSGLAVDFAVATGIPRQEGGMDALLDAEGGWPRLLASEGLRARVARDDWEGWQAELKRLTDEVLLPIESALRRRAIDQLFIHACNGRRFAVQGGRWPILKGGVLRMFRNPVDPWGRT